MHTDHDPIDPNALAELGYEPRDVEPKKLLWPAAIVFGGTIAAGIIGAGLIKWWHIVPEVYVEQRPFVKVQPPAGTPILQNNSNAPGDIADLRRHEAEVLLNRGDNGDGSYRIPLDDAIKLTVQRGLPQTASQAVSHPPIPAVRAETPGGPSGGGAR